ncbi:efflux RND transporter periplasmic adaptor subunit [Pyruvatibacter sp.]|uniref:efflux RND transporter periplasmic adaptor subunit n=1 Tax=Pyruvatibacter sp. TaxID=1981328 RepID=UPI0032EBAADF
MLFMLSACGNEEPAASQNTAPAKASVRIAEIQLGDIRPWIFGEGTARAVDREFLSFESAGRIAYVDPNLKEGDVVNKGQLIAYQEKNLRGKDTTATPDNISHAAVREAKAALDLAQKTFDRFKILLQKRSASQQEFDEAKAELEQAQVQYQNAVIVADESRIVSPIDGVVARLNIEQGFYFSPQQVNSTSEGAALNTVPVVIINPGTFEVRISLPSYTFEQVRVGAATIVEQSGYGGRPDDTERSAPLNERQAAGTVYAVSPSIDPETRTYAARVRTEQGAEIMQDGEFVTVWIAGVPAENVVAVPIDALRYKDGQPFVFIWDDKTSTVAKRLIRTGLSGGEFVQVLAGLSVGDRVVTEGRSVLADGDRVEVIGSPVTNAGKL